MSNASHAKSSHRFRLIVIITLGIVAALGSFWLLEVMRKQVNTVVPPSLRTEPDYYVDNFNFVRMAKTGQAQYLLSGAKLTHNPQNDSVDIQLPIAQNLSPNQAPVTMRAIRGNLNQNSNTIQLNGDVQVTRPPTDKAESLRLKTETLLILTDDNIMQTNDAVEIMMGNSILTGVGMTANNATGVLRVLSKVHSVYHAPTTATR